MKIKKRFWSLLLSCALVCSFMPQMAYAEGVPLAADDVNIETNPGMGWDTSDEPEVTPAEGAWGSAGNYSTSWYDVNETEYTISTAEDLAGMIQLVNSGKNFSGKTIKLGADIYLQADDVSVLNDDGTLNTNNASLKMWTPIGNSASRAFSGTFDGDGHTIIGLYIPSCDTTKDWEYLGLFGYTSQAIIKNVTLEDTYLFAKTKSDDSSPNLYIGGLTACGIGTVIENCDVFGRMVMDVSASFSVLEKDDKPLAIGGIAGWLTYKKVGGNNVASEVTGCTFNGSILGSAMYMGGILGRGSSAVVVEDCINQGVVANQYFLINKLQERSSWNHGFTGGIVGMSASVGATGGVAGDSCIKYCVNSGPVAAKRGYIGGVAGYFHYENGNNVISCKNTGTVQNTANLSGKKGLSERIGGIVGGMGAEVLSDSGSGSIISVTACVNQGTVASQNAPAYIGGIIGQVGPKDTRSIVSCLNTGAVIGPQYANFEGCSGGIVGSTFGNCTIEKCISTGIIRSGTNATHFTGSGGIAGTAGGTIKNCYNAGPITGYKSAGGIAGTAQGGSSEQIIENCYNTGAVTSTKTSGYSGGLVGYLYHYSSGYLTIRLKNSYNTGAVSVKSGSNAGGVAGYITNNKGTVENCYYLSGGTSNTYGTAKSAEEMTDDNWDTTFSGFDRDNVWSKKDNENGVLYLPHLQVFAGNAAGGLQYSNDLNSPQTYPYLPSVPLSVIQESWTYGEESPVLSYTPMSGEDVIPAISYSGIKHETESYGPTATKPTDAGRYTVSVSYEQDGKRYQGQTSFEIEQAAPVGTPSITPITEISKTLKDAVLTGTFTGVKDETVQGTLKWDDGDDTKVQVNTAYGWTFTPDDSNYKELKGTLIPWEDATLIVAGVTVSPTTLSLIKGGTSQLVATVEPNTATNKNVTWSSSDENVATVNENGLVTAIDAGTATITVTTADGGKTATCSVTVTYKIDTSVSLTGGGTVTGGGNYNKDDSVTVTATANLGYKFVKWLEGEEEVSKEASYTFNATGNRTLVAVFEPLTYEVTLNTNGGTINNGKDITSYTYGTGAALPTVSDMTYEGYTFMGWYENADFSGDSIKKISDDDTGNKKYYAKWLSNNTDITSVIVAGKAGTITDTSITVVLPFGTETLPTDSNKVSITTATGAKVSNLRTTDSGATWTFTVTAEDGTTKDYTIHVSIAPDLATENKEDVAMAKEKIENHIWTVAQETANSEEAVKAWIEDQLEDMDLNGVDYKVTMTSCEPATAGDTSDRDGKNGRFTFTVDLSKGTDKTFASDTTNRLSGTITATAYQLKQYTITLTASPAKGGTISGGGTVDENTSVTVTAEANEGYKFVKWLEGEKEVSKKASYTFKVTEDRSLVAVFEKMEEEPSVTPPTKPNKPSINESNKHESESENVSETAQTGDNNHLVFWVFMLLCSVAGVTLVLCMRYRYKDKK